MSTPTRSTTAAVPVPQAGDGSPATIPLTQTGLVGSPEQLIPNSSAGGFVDLTATATPTASSVINCTGSTSTSLTGCTTTATGGLSIGNNDLIEQVIGTTKSSGSVPAGPNTTTGDGGNTSISVNTVTQATWGIVNANAPNRLYINGVAVYCSQSNANPTNKIENCTTGPGGSALSFAANAPITSDPIIPATATGQTNGLISPDGIVGVLPSYPGLQSGDTAVMYTEKILNYYVAGITTNSNATTFGTNFTLTFTPTASFTGFPAQGVPSDMPAPGAVTNTSPVTIYMGDITAGDIVAVTCTGETATTLTGCNTSGPSTDQYNSTSMIGSPGAAIVPNATLNEIGEGAGIPPSAKNIAKLMKNNEDLTILRVAYTSDGVNFSDSGLANQGMISGASGGASNYTDINNPSSQTSPSNLNAYATPGTADATEMRFVGSAGSIITNPDGSYGLFLSGAWAADGDSDSFNQIFYSMSTDGQNWSIPESVVSTDYTFSASAAQDAALQQGEDKPLGISAYYSGRAYGPSVVQNPDGSLTMVFAGYRLPKPITNAGTQVGTNPSALYTVGATDPSLYRNILVVTLSPVVATTTSLGSNTGSPAVGQQVTYTATVAPVSGVTGTPTGTVTFSGDSGVLCTTSLDGDSADQATCTTSYGAPGSDSVTATYNGSSGYTASTSGSVSETISKDQTATSLGFTPPDPVVGEQVTFTAAVSAQSPGAGTPTGMVTVSGDSGVLCSAALDEESTDQASCTATYQSVQSDSVTATYAGDSNDEGSASSPPTPVSVSEASTTTSLSTSDASPVVGETVTYTAVVAASLPGAGTPTGSVAFTSTSSGMLCTSTLDQSSTDEATCTTLYEAPGSDSVTAEYESDGNFASSSSAAQTETISMAATTTGISATPTSPVVGQPVTYTATVTVQSPGSGTPTGSVAFTDSTGTVCNTTLNESDPDTATCRTTYTNTQGDTVTATYSGDTDFSSSVSPPLSESVQPASTSTDLGVDIDEPVVGQSVTYTATVSVTPPGSGTPTGSVTFTGNSGTLCTSSLDADATDQATCTTSYPAVGGDSVTATYVSDTGDFDGSTSNTQAVTISPSSTTTALSTSESAPVVGEDVVYTATVAAASPGSGTPTGTVTFTSTFGGTHTLCTAPSNQDATDQATCTTSYPSVGKDSVTATYNADPNYSGSGSSAESETISAASTSTSLTASTESAVAGQEVEFTAEVNAVAPGSGTPSGEVVFSDSKGTVCSASLNGSTPDDASCRTTFQTGTYSVTAEFDGTPDAIRRLIVERGRRVGWGRLDHDRSERLGEPVSNGSGRDLHRDRGAGAAKYRSPDRQRGIRRGYRY